MSINAKTTRKLVGWGEGKSLIYICNFHEFKKKRENTSKCVWKGNKKKVGFARTRTIVLDETRPAEFWLKRTLERLERAGFHASSSFSLALKILYLCKQYFLTHSTAAYSCLLFHLTVYHQPADKFWICILSLPKSSLQI